MAIELSSDADQPLAFIAPSEIERFLFGMIRSGSMRLKTPRPVHFSHAPNGLLNENILGASSPTETPCSGQA